ncbi:PIN domain-containing protein [Thermococcus peptonophilus]
MAATCSFYGISTLATFDDDFKRVPHLRIIQSVNEV